MNAHRYRVARSYLFSGEPRFWSAVTCHRFFGFVVQASSLLK